MKTMVCGVAMFYNTNVCGVVINSLEITLILQPALSDVIIGPTGAHGNKL